MVSGGEKVVVVEIGETAAVTHFKKKLWWLGFTELLLGLISCVLGIVLLSRTSSIYNMGVGSVLNIGEGLWCGVWIVTAGGLGMACGEKHLTPCVANCHFAFSILGALFSGTMLFASTGVAILLTQNSFDGRVEIVLAIIGFLCLALCCSSTSAWCCSSPYAGNRSNCCSPIQKSTVVNVTNREIVHRGAPVVAEQPGV